MVSLARYWCRAPTQSLSTIPGSRQAFRLDRARRAGGRIACCAAAKFHIPPGPAIVAVQTAFGTGRVRHNAGLARWKAGLKGALGRVLFRHSVPSSSQAVLGLGPLVGRAVIVLRMWRTAFQQGLLDL